MLGIALSTGVNMACMANQSFSQSEQSSFLSSVKDPYHTDPKGSLREQDYDASAGKVQCSRERAFLRFRVRGIVGCQTVVRG